VNAALEQLREEIRQAFPPSVFEGPATDCKCEECTEIRNAPAHKRRDEVPDFFLDFTRSPTLFTPQAFAAFLPAYLLRALDDLEGRTVVLEFTTYCLSPYDSDGDVEQQKPNIERLLTRARVMTVAQMSAVRHFLRFVQGR
jgi:hypothetical protein